MSQTEKSVVTALQSMYEHGEAVAITGLLMEFYTKKNKEKRRADSLEILNETMLQQIKHALVALRQNKPLQYVLGEAWFMNERFIVDEAVLIPRPETEELVLFLMDNCLQPNATILDIGTGSGCIPILLKKKIPTANVSTMDISKAALAVAKKNAALHQVSIQMMEQDFLDESLWPSLPCFHFIISNPPYIPTKEKELLAKNVSQWEPSVALFVLDQNPLLFYNKIAAFGKAHLKKEGKIFVETHQDYAVATQEMFIKNGYDAVLKKDINNHNRMIMAAIK